MSVPAVRGDRIFYTENDGTRSQAVLCMAEGSGTGGWSAILVDPNLLDAGGTTAITVFEPDETGARVVYGLSRDGSDRQELLIHDVAAGATLADRLQWVKFASIAWWGDGFFYTRYPEDQRVFLSGLVSPHRPSAGDDRLIYHRPDAPEVIFDVKMTSDDRHLVITSYQGASDHAEMHVVDARPATRGRRSPRPRSVNGFTAGWHFIDGRDGVLYFRTDAGAPFGRIVRIDLARRRGRGARRSSPNRTTRSSTRRSRTDDCSSARCATPAAG